MADDSLRRRLAGRLFGYDFFISYSHSDAGKYASALADRLHERGFECFLDRRNFVKGDNWRVAGRGALKKTQRLVLLASPDALTSEPVLTELQIFRGEGKRVIPINFGTTLDGEDPESKIFDYISRDDLWISESVERVDQVPSERVVNELNESFELERQQQKRLRWISRVAVALVVLAVAACIGMFLAVTQTRLAETRAREVQLELSNVEFQLAVIARDKDFDPVRAGHHFLRAAAAAKSAQRDDRARSMLIAASGVDVIVGRFSRGATTNADATKVLVWDSDEAILRDATRNRVLSGFKHEAGVRGASFSPNEQQILTWSDDTTAKLWDIEGHELETFPHDGPVHGAVCLAHETHVLTWTRAGKATLWNRMSERIDTFDHKSKIREAVLGKTEVLTWSNNGLVRIWGVGSLYRSAITLDHGNASGRNNLKGAAFTDYGRNVVTWGTSHAFLWNPGSPDEPQTIPSPTNAALIDGIAVSRSQVAIWTATTVCLYNVANLREPLARFTYPSRIAGARFQEKQPGLVVWTQDGSVELKWKTTKADVYKAPNALRKDGPYYFGFGSRGSEFTDGGSEMMNLDTRMMIWHPAAFMLWDVADRRLISAARIRVPLVKSAALTPDGRFLLTTGTAATLWDVRSPEPIQVFGHRGSVSTAINVLGASFNEDETQVLTWSEDGKALLWNVTQAERDNNAATEVRILPHADDTGILRGARYNDDETHVLTWGKDGTAQLWDISDDAPAGENPDTPTFRHESSVAGATFNHDGTKVLTWSEDGAVKLWDSSDDEASLMSRHHHAPISGAAIAAAGSQALTWCSDGTGKLWDATREKPPTSFRHMQALAVTQDETLVLLQTADRSAELREVVRPSPLTRLRESEMMAEETRLVTWAAVDGAEHWGLLRKKPRAGFDLAAPVRGVLSKDGKRVLGTNSVWSLERDEPLATFNVPDDEILGSAFNHDETQVVTWGRQGSAALWDASLSKPLLIFSHAYDYSGQSRRSLRGAAFTHDGSGILTWGSDQRVKLWKIPVFDSTIDNYIRRTRTRMDASGQLEWIVK